jgi:hypothetical protein
MLSSSESKRLVFPLGFLIVAHAPSFCLGPEGCSGAWVLKGVFFVTGAFFLRLLCLVTLIGFTFLAFPQPAGLLNNSSNIDVGRTHLNPTKFF